MTCPGMLRPPGALRQDRRHAGRPARAQPGASARSAVALIHYGVTRQLLYARSLARLQPTPTLEQMVRDRHAAGHSQRRIARDLNIGCRKVKLIIDREAA